MSARPRHRLVVPWARMPRGLVRPPPPLQGLKTHSLKKCRRSLHLRQVRHIYHRHVAGARQQHPIGIGPEVTGIADPGLPSALLVARRARHVPGSTRPDKVRSPTQQHTVQFQALSLEFRDAAVQMPAGAGMFLGFDIPRSQQPSLRPPPKVGVKSLMFRHRSAQGLVPAGSHQAKLLVRLVGISVPQIGLADTQIAA